MTKTLTKLAVPWHSQFSDKSSKENKTQLKYRFTTPNDRIN